MTTKPEFTIDGVEVQTFEEIFSELQDGYRSIYGADIVIDQDTPDGQRIGLEATARLDLQTFGLSLYTQFDPDFAAGEVLNKIIKITGITRRPATRSTVDCTVTTDRDLTLSAGYTVADDTGQNWITLSDQSLITGGNTVSFSAELFGNVEAGIGTITEPVTIVLGVLSVTNAASATAGLDEETDEELRVRRNKSLENASYSTVGGLFAKLANLTGVTDLAIYENDEDTLDAVRNIEAHTIWCIIGGGEVADIAETIAKNKTAGTGLKGTETATYTENVLKPDGSTFMFNHNVKYDRPVEVPLTITVTATRTDASQPIDTALIKTKIAERTYGINQSAFASELYYNGYQAGTNFVLSDMLIDDGVVAPTDESITNDYDEYFSIDTADITVSEVI
jgi:uncharacterized phage protein gp47/JayE